MAYVAVKGGERAIDNAHAWLAEDRRGDPTIPELSLAQIQQQLGRAVDRVMAEGALYDPELAALAIKQAQGDLIEAAFLLRAYRTTLPRFGYSLPVDTGAMAIQRRISSTYKDLPGGQLDQGGSIPGDVDAGAAPLRRHDLHRIHWISERFHQSKDVLA